MFTCFYYSVSVTFATFPLNAATVCVYRSEHGRTGSLSLVCRFLLMQGKRSHERSLTFADFTRFFF